MSPQPENPLLNPAIHCSPDAESVAEFTTEERSLLLKLAHASIEAELIGQKISLEPPSPHLAEPRGAFTTIYIRGELRGCVGYVFPVYSVYRTVAETARSAAFEDARFPPINHEESVELEVSLSILSPTRAIRAEELDIGKHGLLVSQHGQRGLLLPQVPVEHAWDRVTFLEQTCRKAGLPLDAWRHGAKLEAFTAEIFGDRNLK
ncbi:MAG: AmmeMemoRadiSam system protein A [Terriglobales bacterium]